MKLTSWTLDGNELVLVVTDDAGARKTEVVKLGDRRQSRDHDHRYFRCGADLTIQVRYFDRLASLYVGEDNHIAIHWIDGETIDALLKAIGFEGMPDPWLPCPVCYEDLETKAPGVYRCEACAAKAVEEAIRAREAAHVA